MKEYDSILKEKKVYQDPVVHHSKYTKYILIYILLCLIILGISYTIYYQNILSPSNIFLNDANTFLKKYQNIFSYIIPENIEDLKNLEGPLLLEDSPYNLSFSKEEETTKIEVSNQQNYVVYQKSNQEQYLQLSSLSDKIIQLENSTISVKELQSKIKNNLTNDKFIKNFYLENKTPIVEINLVLTTTDLNQILEKNIIKDNLEILITLKNNAFSNNHIYSKIVVNNQTKNTRVVYTYDNEKIEYTNQDGDRYQVTLSRQEEDFNLKIYHEEELYSIFLGKKLEKTYQYTYQVIDQVYNLTLNFTQEEDEYQYEFISNIEKNNIQTKQTFQINLHPKEENLPEESNKQIISYNNLTTEEKETYQQFLDTFFLPFREFIKEYQEDINELND